MHRLLVPLALTLSLTACDEAPGPIQDGDLIAVGDSIFDFHGGDQDVPGVVGEALGRSMVNNAIGGTMVTAGEDAIPAQYTDGPWSWLVAEGGGNDLNDRCGCGDCAGVLDEIVSEDGTAGAMADFALEVADSGVGVVLMGYPGLPDGAEFGFDRCGEWLPRHSARLAALAGQHERIVFVDAREVADGTDLSLFDGDRVHPSIEGSRAMGEHIAAAIEGAD